jgi:hypothetical protein
VCAAVALAAAVYFLFVGVQGLLMVVLCLCTAGGFIIASTGNWARVRLLAARRRDDEAATTRPPR